jgi:cyclopropane fatty-acyl-phospholipid synthase-like methyltransferase
MKEETFNESFYSGYQDFKKYKTPNLKNKHVKYYDRHFWHPTKTKSDMSVLEIGCGTGHFLRYLHFKGVSEIQAIDNDPTLEQFIHPDVRPHFLVANVFDFLNDLDKNFDRIVLFDVLEHFNKKDGKSLLLNLTKILEKDGCIIVQVPNMSSPWGIQHQFGDLTHKTAYTPGSMRQLAIISGLSCTACYPQIQGSPLRKLLSFLLHGLLSKILPNPPEIWSGNFIAILRRQNENI